MRNVVVLVLEAVFFAATLSFLTRSSADVQLGLMLLTPVLFVLWLITLTHYLIGREGPDRRVTGIAAALAPAALFSALLLSRPLRAYYFQRDLPRMREIVRGLENGTLAIKRERPVGLSEQQKSFAYSIQAYRDKTNALTVTFYVGGGFPVKHQAYLYRSDDTLTPEVTRDWVHGTKRAPRWYEVSD